MRFIKKWSYGCAFSLARQLNENHEKRGVYYYAFQIIIGSAVKAAAMALISLLLGIFKETVAVMAFFISLRVIAGGFHMDTYGKCFAASTAIFLLSGALVKYVGPYLGTVQIAILAAAVFFLGLGAVIKWAPADTPNKPITKLEQIKRLKKMSAGYFLVWLAAIAALLAFDFRMYALAGCVGVLLSIFIISPAGYRFFGAIGEAGNMRKRRKTAN